MNKDNKKESILIVDDDPQIHKLLSRMLSNERFDVESTFSVNEAINAIKKKRPDLIVLDLMMPKVSGIEVLNFVRQNSDLENILILILSAKDAQMDRLDGLSHGADDYVVKPFHMRHLVRKIEHMLDKKRERENRTIN